VALWQPRNAVSHKYKSGKEKEKNIKTDRYAHWGIHHHVAVGNECMKIS
jgi:hypothetical protein